MSSRRQTSSCSGRASWRPKRLRRSGLLIDSLRVNQRDQGDALDVSARELTGFVETQRNVVERARDARMTTSKSARTITASAEVSQKTADEVEALIGNIQEATEKLYDVVRGSQEVERNVVELSGYADTSRAAMEGMRAKIEHVEQNASAAEQLAERVIGASRRGQEAVERATSGMDAIRLSSRQAGETIRDLDGRIDNIDEILRVIQDVADETQLLSLNASIIAAQAGEFGRPFSVVADEIKKLAQRTSKSTEEIADIIRAVQEGSRAAIVAIEGGERSVEDGLTRSRQAESALGEIVEASEETTTVVKNIAALTVDQAMQTNHVAQLANQVAGNASQIADVTGMHVARVAEIERIAAALAASSTTLQLTATETRESSQRVVDNTREVEEAMERIHVAQEEQTRSVERILSAIDAIRAAARAQVEATRAVTAQKEET